MLKILVPLALVLVLLEGCSLGGSRGGKDSGKVTVNWDCVRDGGSGTQTCHKRRMRNGKPVDDEIFDTVVIAGDEAPPPIPDSPHNPPANAGDAVPWNRQPLSTVNSIDDSARLEVENLGPEVPKGRNTADIWGSAKGKKPAGDTVDRDTTGARTGYTLQMAAFSSPERCELFIARDKPDALSTHKRIIANQGRNWCIVTHGDFGSQAEAVAASKRFRGQYPGHSFWVRSWKTIRELEVTE